MTTSRHTPDNCKIRKHLGTCEICEREPETVDAYDGDSYMPFEGIFHLATEDITLQETIERMQRFYRRAFHGLRPVREPMRRAVIRSLGIAAVALELGVSQ